MGKMMADKDILLGIDFGSGGCKVSAIDTVGTLVGEASVEYPTHYPHPGFSEQEPADWYAAMCRALALLRERNVDFRRIAAVAFDGSTHNAVLLDGNMTPLRRTIMWTDQRSVEECAYLKAHCAERIFATAWQMPTPTWTLPQLMWVRNHEKEVIEKTEHVLFAKDYVRYLVTGVSATDYIEAQGTLFFDMAKREWAEELVALTGLKMSALPRLLRPCDRAGSVTRTAARDTGIPEGTPVICGSSDSAVEDYGAGAVEPGDCIVKLATAGNVNVMTDRAVPHERTLTYSHIVEGMYYTVSATNAAAVCQRWFRDNFCDTEKRLASERGAKAFNLMDELAETSPAGSNGIFFHPYLQGERSPYWDPDLRGSFTGIGMGSTRADFARALLEGVGFSLLDCYGLIEEMKLPVKRLFLIGGGGRSRLWSSIVCNIFNLPLAVPSPGDASFGTALLAGSGVGIFSDPREAVRRCLRIDRELAPDPGTAETYRKLFASYKALHDAMAPVYRAMRDGCRTRK